MPRPTRCLRPVGLLHSRQLRVFCLPLRHLQLGQRHLHGQRLLHLHHKFPSTLLGGLHQLRLSQFDSLFFDLCGLLLQDQHHDLHQLRNHIWTKLHCLHRNCLHCLHLQFWVCRGLERTQLRDVFLF